MGRSRLTKVLGVLTVSMLLGAAILNAMSHNPLSASAFCLSQYYDLAPIEDSLGHGAARFPQRWNQIEIRYGNHGDFQTGMTHGSGKFSSQPGPSESTTQCEAADCHFIICDGYIGDDGQIQSTANWLSQFAANRNTQDRPELPEDTGQTICICIATTDELTAPTDVQMRRTEALVEELCRRFRIEPEAIRYPSS